VAAGGAQVAMGSGELLAQLAVLGFQGACAFVRELDVKVTVLHEGAVIAEAIDVIESGKPRMLEFGVADETAWQVGLSCGGRIKVYVERLG
jgi:hypothetical protein